MLKTINITGVASIKHPLELSFGRTNLILGGNNTGKSAICDAIACLFDYGALLQTIGRFSGDYVSIGAEITGARIPQFKVQREIELKNKKFLNDTLIIDDIERSDLSFLTSLLKVIHVKAYSFREFNTDRDLARFCISQLTAWRGNLRRHHFGFLKSFAKQFNFAPFKLVEAIDWQPSGKLTIKTRGNDFWVPRYSNLSNGEKSWLLTDISIFIGELFAMHSPTLLLLDDILTPLSDSNMKRLGTRINGIMNPNLQIVLTTWKDQADSIISPDCVIRLAVNESGTYIVDRELRTPKSLLDLAERIRQYQSGDEDKFINSIVLPLLHKMGFYHLHGAGRHGPGEMGIDIGPFIGKGFEWRNAFCGAQVKTIRLSGKSGSVRNVNILIDEVKKALSAKFLEPGSTFRSTLDYILVFLSQDPTREAIQLFNDAFEGNRRVILLNPMSIAELMWKYGTEY